MTARSRYDSQEDRMWLEVGTSENARRRFWITRRLWLLMLRRLDELAGCGDVRTQHPPPHSGKKIEAVGREDTQLVEAVRMQPAETGVKISFIVAERSVNIQLPRDAVQEWHRMFEVQADRAGWDPVAALERLRASAAAGDALRRAKAA